MLKKLLIIAFVIVAITGCTREEQQANAEAPVATAVGSGAAPQCKHHDGTCTCEGHGGEPCSHHGEEITCTCASCGHEWKCEAHEGEACHHGEEGCVCKCPQCGAECKCECGDHGAKGHACKGECGAECTCEGHKGACACEGHEGEACLGGDGCTCKHDAHGETQSASDNPGCDEKAGCPAAASGQAGCGRKGSCKSRSGS
jgi:hypothetical protein